MPNISVRGLDDDALAQLKDRAQRENDSVNSLVLRLIDQGLGRQAPKARLRRHDDLDALSGSWCRADGDGFERATAAFGKVDAALWK